MGPGETITILVFMADIFRQVFGGNRGPGETITILVFLGAIVAITAILGNTFKNRGASKKELTQIHADLNELKKGLAEIREYITDMYIQQHDQRLK